MPRKGFRGMFGGLLLLAVVLLVSGGTANPRQVGSHHLGLLAYPHRSSL